MAQRHAFESLSQDLRNSISAAEDELKDDNDALAKATQSIADT